MNFSSLFNFRRPLPPPAMEGTTHVVQPQRALRRVLDFTGKSIDDVVNDSMAKRMVQGYFKLHRWVEREVEIGDLERQWNRV